MNGFALLTGNPQDFVAPNDVSGDQDNGETMVSEKLLENADVAARFLAAVGNEKRLAIMCHLLAGEMSVGQIAERVKLSQSALSQHLAKLRSQDLVETRRERQMIFYSCRSGHVRILLLTLDTIFGARASAA